MYKARIAVVLFMGIMLVLGSACGTTEWQLTSIIEGQGAVSPSEGKFSDGSEVTLTALPASGWSFDHWGGQATGADNPITVTMDSDKTVYAYFISGLTPQPTPTPTPTPEGGIISITAGKLCDDYNANEIAADQEYKDKFLEISSEIEDIDREPLSDRAYLTMDCGIITNIWCYFDEAYEFQLISLEEGDNVTIRGICTGKDILQRIKLEHCIVK